MPLGVEGEPRHQHQRRLVVRLGFVCNRLGDVIRPGRDGTQIVQPQKFHRIAIYLRHGDALSIELRLPEHRHGAHLLIVRQIPVDALRLLIERVRAEQRCKLFAAGVDLRICHGALFGADDGAKLLFIHGFPPVWLCFSLF